MPDDELSPDAAAIGEAAGAHALFAGEADGFTMRIGDVLVRWHVKSDVIHAVTTRRTSISFATGRPEPTLNLPLRASSETPLFVSGSPHLDPTSWLASGGAARVFDLTLGAGDQLLVATNQSFLTFQRRRTAADDGYVLRSLAALIASLPPPLARVSPNLLSPEFSALQGFVERWAVADDVQRAEVIGAASTEDLARLHEAVAPAMPEITSLLDRDEDPQSGLPLAGRLALAAVEAELELVRRGVHGPWSAAAPRDAGTMTDDDGEPSAPRLAIRFVPWVGRVTLFRDGNWAWIEIGRMTFRVNAPANSSEPGAAAISARVAGRAVQLELTFFSRD